MSSCNVSDPLGSTLWEYTRAHFYGGIILHFMFFILRIALQLVACLVNCFFHCLLQVEVLGVSLPWRDILSNKGPGVKYAELVQKCQKGANPFRCSSDLKVANPFLHDSDINPYDNNSSSNKSILPSVQSGVPVGHGVDLLTGDFLFSQTITETEMQSSTENAGSGAAGLIDFFGDSAIDRGVQEADSSLPLSLDASPKDSITSQHYINCFRALSGPHMVYNPFANFLILYDFLVQPL